jgi:hypothetical protein
MTTPTDIMSSSASGSAAGYVTVNPTFHIRFLVSIAFVSTLYIFAMTRSHKHIHDAINLLIISILWIKLLLKLPKILTIQKCDRQFSVVGFASMLKPNVIEGTHYKRWRQRCILWLTSMHCYFVAKPRAVGPHTPDK